MADPFPLAKVAVNSEIQRATSPDPCPVAGCTIVVVRVDLSLCAINCSRPSAEFKTWRTFSPRLHPLFAPGCTKRLPDDPPWESSSANNLSAETIAQSSFLKIRCRKPLGLRRRGGSGSVRAGFVAPAWKPEPRSSSVPNWPDSWNSTCRRTLSALPPELGPQESEHAPDEQLAERTLAAADAGVAGHSRTEGRPACGQLAVDGDGARQLALDGGGQWLGLGPRGA